MNNRIKQFIKDNLTLVDEDNWEAFWGLVEKDEGNIFEDMRDIKDLTEFLLECACDTLKNCTAIPEGYLCCSDRSEIKIPENINCINFGAFCGMVNLTQVTIPVTVEIIADEAFYECTNLQEVTILNPKIVLSGGTFRDCPNLMLIKYNGTKKQFYSCFDDVAPLNEGCLVITTEGPIQL